MQILSKLKAYFPDNRAEWKLYLAKTIPIVFGALFFALNSFVDNFMVTSIPNATASLGFANSWTAVITSFFIGVGVFGSVLVGQFYGAKKYQQVVEVVNYRISFSLLITLIFAIVAWSVPGPFLDVFSHGQDRDPAQTIEYLRIIAISWVLLAFAYNSGNLLREVAFAKLSFISTLITLFTNIIFNLLFVYVAKWGAVGTAYASVIATGVGLILSVVFLYRAKREIMINYFLFWKFSKVIFIQFNKRILGTLIYSVAINLVVFRSSLWNFGFPSLGPEEYQVTGPGVLGLALAIANLMTSSFQAINGNINYFVGRFIGIGDWQLALRNSKKVMGINFLVALSLTIATALLIYILTLIPGFASGVHISAYNYMVNVKHASEAEATATAWKAEAFYLNHLRETVWVAAVYNPIWMLLLTTLRIIGSGGRSNIVSLANMISGILQIVWLAIIVYAILPYSSTLRENLALSTVLFYASDIIKWGGFELMKLKMQWIRNLNVEHEDLVAKEKLPQLNQ
ncbi:Na+-driven multidrug efflux pump [Mycoplasmoides fastidiosum]|uniref:Probable multidrug resistance protein NorM n=1 Tax=Mycoplasmoides fastidiosum TaxID=92758 RepID=A0ABU0LYF6_9BACT|nr:MATE family efflux transporter [Mycoplasmoides fastidiosum]MDQ0513729.1 Na+-driven multidrug efflux pump [Mycoplasmoides fastidiosum]UUD37849.1 MATE family efflux transporter [Mycoplasmoides fastidiosum]